ncbi:MAG: hypothetical protein ABR556_07630 [Pyrinomonadaceae bacterium]
MSRHTRGNSKCSPATQAAVAGGTPGLWPGRSVHVLSMIKFDIEAFVKLRGKTLQRRVPAINIRMTDYAHGNIGSNKLRQVATRARLMPRKPWRRRIIAGAFVASVARQRRVTLSGVPEVRVVEIGILSWRAKHGEGGFYL